MIYSLERALEESAKSVVPGGPEGKLGRKVHAHVVYPHQIIIGTQGSAFARALNRGFTSTAKKGLALRFEVTGGERYRKRVRVAGRHFFEKWLELAPPIVDSVYRASFYDLKAGR
jgi:hypothetical protein